MSFLSKLRNLLTSKTPTTLPEKETIAKDTVYKAKEYTRVSYTNRPKQLVYDECDGYPIGI